MITRNTYTQGKGEFAWDTWPNRLVLKLSLQSENETNDLLKSGPALAGPAGSATPPLPVVHVNSTSSIEALYCTLPYCIPLPDLFITQTDDIYMQHIAPSKCPFLYQYPLLLVWLCYYHSQVSDCKRCNCGCEKRLVYNVSHISDIKGRKGLKDVNCTWTVY